MKVTTKTLDNCEVLMTVEIDDRQRDEILKKAARKIAREVKIPGFRPGKAPYRLILSRFGEEAIQEEAMDHLTQTVYKRAIKEAGIEPYALATMEEIEWNPLVMQIKVPTEPVVELGDYNAMRLEAEAVEVSDDEVAHQLEQLAERYTTFEPVERAAQLGDMVSVAISEKDIASGEVLDEDREMEITLEERGDDASELDLLTPLTGMSEGQEKTFTHTFSKNYPEKKYAGKEIEFHVLVNTVKAKEEVELDDDFAMTVGDFDTLDELKEKLREDIAAQKQYEVDGELIERAVAKLVEEAKTIKWPPVVEEEELDNAIKNQEFKLEQKGLNLNAMLSAEQKTLEEYREELREQVRENLKTGFALSKLVELEGLQVDGDEITQQAEWMIAMSGGSQEARKVYTSQEGVRVIANNILTDKARRRLLAIVKGEAEVEETEAEETEEIAKAEETAKETAVEDPSTKEEAEEVVTAEEE